MTYVPTMRMFNILVSFKEDFAKDKTFVVKAANELEAMQMVIGALTTRQAKPGAVRSLNAWVMENTEVLG